MQQPKRLGMPEDGEEEIKDYAAEALSRPREPVDDARRQAAFRKPLLRSP